MAGDMMLSRRQAIGAAGFAGLALAHPALAWAPLSEPALDAIVDRFMREFPIPGVAIAVVRPGRPDYVRGYGVRVLGKPGAVDERTLFGIASNSKAFTAAALAMLVDEGKLAWDEPVIKYLPEFQLSDPDVTKMFTVRDLLVHRSGLPLGAGDLMQFPETDLTAEDILRGLRYLKFGRGFRSGYDYDNSLYVVAGLLLGRVAGQSWADFVTARLLRPLGMVEAVPVRSRIRTRNLAGRHAQLGPPVRGMGKLDTVLPDETDAVGPAGGINVGVAEYVAWLRLQLAQGALPDGRRLYSEAQAKELWTPQTLVSNSIGPAPDQPTRPVLSAYALGWFIQDYRGHRMVWHSGGLSGQITYTVLFPELGIAFALFSNTETGGFGGMRNAVADYLLGAPAFDWVAATRDRLAKGDAEVLALVSGGELKAPAGGPSLPLAAYAGRYRDPWYGDVVIALKRGKLAIDFTHTPVFKSALEPWGPDAFRTRFPRGAGEDAVATFVIESGRPVAIKMKALSPLADFSYDFHDLDLRRVD